MDVYGLCLGGNVFGWTADRDASFAVLDAYVEAGGNFIDTADTYMRPNMGISETIIGEWMAARGNRDELVIATKVGSDGGLSAANIAAHVDASLARLQTDRIDLYYAHKDDGSVPVEETVRAFDALVRDGKVLHVAASNAAASGSSSRWSSPSAKGWRRYEWLQPHYNLVEREGYEREYAPIVERFGLAVAPYYALASGFLTGKYRGDANGDSPRAERASGYLDERGKRVLDALDEVADAHGVPSPRSRSPGCWRSRASRRRSPAPGRPSNSPTSCRRQLQLDRRRDHPTRRGLRLMDATRQTFLDELYAHGRAHDERTRTGWSACATSSPRRPSCSASSCARCGAKRVLEIGTSNGYSTIWLGDAAEAVGGTVLWLEIEAERTAQAVDNLAEAGVEDFVELRTQDAAEALRTFADGAFDLIFLDAERTQYAGYWPDLMRVLRDSGLLVVDNTLSHAKDLVEFSELVYAERSHLDARDGRRRRAADRQVALSAPSSSLA